MDLRQRALDTLALADPDAKADAAQTLWRAVRMSAAPDAHAASAPAARPPPHTHLPVPGRPARPSLVPAAQVPRRSPATPAGRAALMHAVAHIEFNAINLALDAVWRFGGMPSAYYREWLSVAADEARHFIMVRQHLRSLGHDYGDFAAHDGLWAMTERTASDLTARMALVPRTLEARGLDATPPMQRKLAQAGDAAGVAVLEVILRDEIGHVAIGNHWYRWLCARDGLDPIAHYAVLAQRHGAPPLLAPLNLEARAQAGFTADELALMVAGGR